MKKIYFLILLGLFLPYWWVGIDFGNSILLLCGICVLFFEKTICYRKTEMFLALGISALGIFSVFRSSNMIHSMEGLSLYLALPIFIALFRTYIDETSWKETGSIFSYGVLLSAVLSISISFFFQASRLEGFMNYSNSYGLLLLVGYIFYRSVGERKLLASSAEIFFLWGILLTGSRTTLGLLLLYAVWELFRERRRKIPPFFLLYMGISLGLYVLYERSKPWALFALILILTLDYLFKPESLALKKIKNQNLEKLNLKRLNLGIVILTIFSGAGFFLSNSSLLNRLREISMETGVLQERFIIFHDAIIGILKNPLGYGINSFPYMQYYNQTAFYDVRYIHNGIIQTGFDIGGLGLLFFLFLLILWAKELLYVKSSEVLVQDSEREVWKQLLWTFGIIVVHSMLDFDLSYFLLFIPILLITGSTGQKVESKRTLLGIRISLALIGIITLYTLSVSALFMVGEAVIKTGNYDEGIEILKLGEYIAPENADFNILKAQAYFLKGDREANISCEENLKMALEKNPMDLSIYMNLGFFYKKLENYDEMMACFKKAVIIQKYNPALYSRSIAAIKEFSVNKVREGITPDKRKIAEKYKADEKWFRDKYSDSLKTLNPRARYLKNQLRIIE